MLEAEFERDRVEEEFMWIWVQQSVLIIAVWLYREGEPFDQSPKGLVEVLKDGTRIEQVHRERACIGKLMVVDGTIRDIYKASLMGYSETLLDL